MGRRMDGALARQSQGPGQGDCSMNFAGFYSRRPGQNSARPHPQTLSPSFRPSRCRRRGAGWPFASRGIALRRARPSCMEKFLLEARHTARISTRHPWISGKAEGTRSAASCRAFHRPACVIDCSKEGTRRGFPATEKFIKPGRKAGRIPPHGLGADEHRLVETQITRLQNYDETGQHTRGRTWTRSRVLVEQREVLGFGTSPRHRRRPGHNHAPALSLPHHIARSGT